MEFFTVAEAAKQLRMSTAWVRQKIFKKEIRYLKIGRRVFIPRTTVEDIIGGAIVEPRRTSK